jgi:nucleoid-associated protein YgaU
MRCWISGTEERAMGCVQQAVLEFDEEVAAPWRPRLVAAPELAEQGVLPGPARASSPRPARSTPSRVGTCRPAASLSSPEPARRPSAAARRPSAPARDRVSLARPLGDARVRPQQRGRLRLTARARRLAVVLALAAGVALGSWLAPLLSGGVGGDLRLTGQSSVSVEPGDTLWSIASSVAGSSDVRVVIDRIRQMNGLRTADLVPGQVLRLP